jgi:hypothetical protein
MNSPVYELLPDINLLIKLTDANYPDEDPTFVLNNMEYRDLGGRHGSDVGANMREAHWMNIQERLIFAGRIDALQGLNFAPNNLDVFLMDAKMLSCLEGVSEFDHQILPARILDDQEYELSAGPRAFADDAIAAGHRYNDDFFILHPLGQFAVPETPDENVGQLPPIFRSEYGSAFVTAAARERLISAGIHGVDFSIPYAYRKLRRAN